MCFSEMKIWKVNQVLKVLHLHLGLLTLQTISLLQVDKAGQDHFRLWASQAAGRLTLPSALAGVPRALGKGSEHVEQRKPHLLQLPLIFLPSTAKLL